MKNRLNEAEKLDNRPAGHKRRVLPQTKATLVTLELIKETMHHGIPAKHVLFDTWFCSPSSLTSIKGIGFDSIAMTKKTPEMHYQYNSEVILIPEIYKQNRKRRWLSKYLLSVDVNVVKDEVSIPVKLVFVRNLNKKKDYLAIISTESQLYQFMDSFFEALPSSTKKCLGLCI
ncbi:MAG: hypothetical protein ACRC76_00280 [Proteocatella sp.]